MSDTFSDFDNRLRRISKSRVKLAKGYVSVVGDDGLIIVKPRRKRIQLPIRGALLLFVGFLGFKAMVLVSLGQPVYMDRVGILENGTAVERVGAWVMQADPLTVMVADKIRALLP
jgi:hypothetical protein